MNQRYHKVRVWKWGQEYICCSVFEVTAEGLSYVGQYFYLAELADE